MRQVILYSALSLDGFIAQSNGSVDWLHDPSLIIEGEDYGYSEFYNSIDTTLMGASTCRQVLGFDIPFPYSGKTNYVFSRKTDIIHEELITVNDDIIGFVQKLKKSEGKNIWLIGGGQINGLLDRAGLIDEYILSYMPVFIGSGIKLFEGQPHFRNVDLKNSKVYSNGIIQQWLRPRSK